MSLSSYIMQRAYVAGAYGCCELCGGPVEGPDVWRDCPPRPLLHRLAFWLAKRLRLERPVR